MSLLTNSLFGLQGEVQEYKVLLIGDKGVGKTSFLLRIMSDKFVAATSSAEPGVDAYTKERVTYQEINYYSQLF
jgi:GTPase SAR1 family protein